MAVFTFNLTLEADLPYISSNTNSTVIFNASQIYFLHQVWLVGAITSDSATHSEVMGGGLQVIT